MKKYFAIILMLGGFLVSAQDIPYMSGKLDYLKKGDFHLKDSSYLKALSVYEKGLKKRPEDSLVYLERIAAVQTLLQQEALVVATDEIDQSNQVENQLMVAMKLELLDLETLNTLKGDIRLKNNRTGEVLTANSDGVYNLTKGEEYNVHAEKDGYYDVVFALETEGGGEKQALFLATSKIQKFEIVKVQAGLNTYNFELSHEDFFERTQLIKDSADYLIQSIYFDFDKADVSESTDLSSLAALMKKYDHLKLEIRGFTDSRGRNDYNKALSESRIESVVSELVAMDVSRQRLTLVPLGEEQLVSCQATQCTESEHAKNRRVDFVLRSDLQNHRQLSMLNE
ncbi:OmpA family protein [Ekhidna sp.]|uniref:OmpA family protein n=1 Tax=Ekhidna sp. TaxID=2608089 RepID=UPI003CCBBBE0